MLGLFERLRPAAVAIVVGATLAGCVAQSEHVERDHLSGEVQERTGHAIRADAFPTPDLPPDVDIADGVSEDEAIALALWKNAAFQESLAQLGLARADLARAGLLTNPTFSILFPIGPKQLEFTLAIPLEALWLRPRHLAIAEIDAERQESQRGLLALAGLAVLGILVLLHVEFQSWRLT